MIGSRLAVRFSVAEPESSASVPDYSRHVDASRNRCPLPSSAPQKPSRARHRRQLRNRGRRGAVPLGAGAKVTVNYVVNPDGANAIVADINANGGDAIAVQGDVSSEADVLRMFGDVVSHYGALDILINNAGLQRDSRIADMTLDKWNFVIGVNLTGQFLCAREAVRQFKKQGPRPVSVSLGKIVCMSR